MKVKLSEITFSTQDGVATPLCIRSVTTVASPPCERITCAFQAAANTCFTAPDLTQNQRVRVFAAPLKENNNNNNSD